MKVGKNTIDFSSPKVMAIVNVTPDSFFDGGSYTELKAVWQRIDKVVAEGADIIDLGACSTKPGVAVVGQEEEWERLVPALTYLREKYPHIPISVDTFRAETAERVLNFYGEFILNDISAGTLDDKLLQWVGEHKLPYVLMHIQGEPETMQENPTYEDVILEVYQFLEQKITELRAFGVADIIIDLGFGFGKTVQHNYSLLKNIPAFDGLNCPMLVGISRKSMIYNVLETSPKEALNGTTVLNTVALERGAELLRVHDVKEAKEAILLMNSLQKS